MNDNDNDDGRLKAWEWLVLAVVLAAIVAGVLVQAFCGGKYGPWTC